MARMLGTETQHHRGKNFWYCCYGHDGWSRKMRIIRKRIMRRVENRSIRSLPEAT